MKRLVGKLDQAGCRGIKVVLKSDQEESIVALKKAVAIMRQAPTVSIESPVRPMGMQSERFGHGQPR